MSIDQIEETVLTRERPYLIAEAGVNHEGSLAAAIELVDAAAESGADMIKFQSYKAERIACSESPAYWDRSEEPSASQYELFRKYDSFDIDSYERIAERCGENGISFCSTAFDSYFVDALDPLMPVYKVASADITNTPLLRQIASKSKPVLLSTGASSLVEIASAVQVLEENGCQEIGLLHCVLEYPLDPKNANLLSIRQLGKCFPQHTIGWSDHVPPGRACLSMIAAWMLGAVVMEKHFTLDKTRAGNDHYHAMDPNDLRNLRAGFQDIQLMLGREDIGVLECEAEARVQARRSLVARVDIPSGTAITEGMLIPKRPGIGISPDKIDLIVGRVPKVDIDADAIVQWEMFA